MISKVRMATIGAAMAAAALSLATPAAQAAPTALPPHITVGTSAPISVQASTQCTQYPHVCLWSNRNYDSNYGAWAQTVNRLPSGLWNRVSSFWNRLPGAVVFYREDNRQGSVALCVDPGASVQDLLTDVPAGWNDNIQSFDYFPNTRC